MQQPMMKQFPRQQMTQHPSQQMPPGSAQQPGQHAPLQMEQQAPLSQNPQAPQVQGPQYSHQQQMQYMPYQQRSSHQQQGPHSAPGQALPNQRSSYPPREEQDFQRRNQSGFSPSQFQQASSPSLQNLPTGTSPAVQMPPRAIHPTQPQQYGGSLGNMQLPSSYGHQPQSGTELVLQQHGSRFRNQMDPGMIRSQQPNMPPLGPRSLENNFQGGVGNDYYSNGSNDGPAGAPHHKIAALPATIARSQQEMGISGAPFQNGAPSQGMNNMYSHPTGGPPFSNNAPVKPSYAGPTSVSNLSPVQAYLQQYEISATGDNVPAPFMTFEETGFPPEILRDVRYLLRSWSLCRTLHCYCHSLHMQQLFSFLVAAK